MGTGSGLNEGETKDGSDGTEEELEKEHSTRREVEENNNNNINGSADIKGKQVRSDTSDVYLIIHLSGSCQTLTGPS